MVAKVCRVCFISLNEMLAFFSAGSQTIFLKVTERDFDPAMIQS